MSRLSDEIENIQFTDRRPKRNDPEERDGNIGDIIQKIDVDSFAGLMTILAVNLQQLYVLVSVGSELGPMFYFLISLASISAILVVSLLVIRSFLERCKKGKLRNTKSWNVMFYTSLVLNVLICVINLVLQIFDQTMEKCQVLLNQPLPISDKPQK